MQRILVMEDERDLLDVLVQLFRHAGYEAVGVPDGLEGARCFEEALAAGAPFDLALVDIMMPGLDGFAVCGRIRRVSQAPIIVLTALDGEDAQLKGYGLGIDDYVTKPFSLKVVLERVRAVLRRSGGPAAGAPAAMRGTAVAPRGEAVPAWRPTPHRLLICGEVVLDADARTVRRSGVPVELTPKEFDILQLLLESGGRVLTRRALVEQVWGYEHVGDERIVNLHVMNIRRKLGEGLVETVRGVGYRGGYYHA